MLTTSGVVVGTEQVRKQTSRGSFPCTLRSKRKCQSRVQYLQDIKQEEFVVTCLVVAMTDRNLGRGVPLTQFQKVPSVMAGTARWHWELAAWLLHVLEIRELRAWARTAGRYSVQGPNSSL